MSLKLFEVVIKMVAELIVKALVEPRVGASNHSVVAIHATSGLKAAIADTKVVIRSAPRMAIAANGGAVGDRFDHGATILEYGHICLLYTSPSPRD